MGCDRLAQQFDAVTSANWFEYILLPCPITVYQCPRSKPIGDWWYGERRPAVWLTLLHDYWQWKIVSPRPPRSTGWSIGGRSILYHRFVFARTEEVWITGSMKIGRAKPSLESKPRENKVVSCSFTRDFIVLREDKIVYLLSGFWVLNLTFLFLSFTKNCEISSRPVVVVIVSEIQSIRDYVSNYLTFFSRYIRVTSLTLQLRFLTQEFHLLLFQVGNSKIKSAGRLLVEAVCSERRSIRYYNWINTRDIVTRVDNNFEGIKERELSSI